jgi:hypothetical protein
VQYYQKAVTTPYGQRVRTFYTTTSKQMLDIHEEAKRIAAAQHPVAAPGTAAAPTTGAAPATADPAAPAAAAVPVHTETAPTVVWAALRNDIECPVFIPAV